MRSTMLRYLSLLVLWSLSTLGFGQAANTTRSELAPVDKVFAPQGFDDDDNVELILQGVFPSTCWRMGEVKADVDQAERVITIAANAEVAPEDAVCALRIVPFIHVVPLGALAAGEYRVDVVGRPKASTTLVIDEASTHGASKDVYLPVESVSLIEDDGQLFLTLRGTYPYMLVGCLAMRDVEVRRDADDLITVLPHAELVEGDECLPQNDTMKFLVKEPLDLADGQYLLHVRTLSGQSLNELVGYAISDTE